MINNLLNRKSKNSKSINLLEGYKNNNKVTHDPTPKPNILNDHFAIFSFSFMKDFKDYFFKNSVEVRQ